MSRWPSLPAVRAVAAIAAAVAAICLAVAVTVLVPTVDDQQDRLAHQSLELECRGDIAAEGDTLRNSVIIWLSRGLRATVEGDTQRVADATTALARLDEDLTAHNLVRERTVEICSGG